jgi:serine/threonine protein kinase
MSSDDPRAFPATPAFGSLGDLEVRQICELAFNELFGEPAPGSGRYQIVRKLGAGGMGIVYAAYDPVLDCTVALKQLRPELGRSLIERLRREARAMARLRSEPHVVTLYDFFAQGEQVFVVMEYVEGSTLHAWQQSSRSWTAVLDKYMQAGAGLAAAHRAGLVHRDFKAHNVLIDQRGVAKVGDFGLAHPDLVQDGAALASAHSDEACSLPHGGTPRYMSPEQAHGEPLDGRSDQFSFCVALYEALFGQHPFWPMNKTDSTALAGEASSTVRTPMKPTPALFLAANTHGAAHPPPESTSVPGHVLHALRRGLSKRPADRFASMDDLLTALRTAPTRRGRWVALALATLAGSTALTFMAADPAIRPKSRDALITEARESLERELQIDGLRDRLRGAPEAGHIAGELSRYAVRWAERHADEELMLRRRPGDPAATTRQQCLEQARRAATTLASALEHAAPAGAAAIAEHVEALPAPEQCATMSHARLACTLELADLAESPRHAPVFAAMRDAARAEASGDLLTAIDAATEATELAADGPELLLGQAHFLHGRLLYLASRPEPAITALTSARDVVLPTGCIDLQEKVYSRMIKVTALNPSLPGGSADEWIRVQAELARAAHDGGALLADAYNDRGLFRLMRGSAPGRALPDLQNAIELRERVLAGRPSADLADSYLNVGIAYWQLGQPDKSRRAFADARHIRGAVLGRRSLYKEDLSQGLLELEAGDHGLARYLLKKALEDSVPALGRDNLQAVKALLGLAQSFQIAEDLDAALEYATEAERRAAASSGEPTELLEARVALAGLMAVAGDRTRDEFLDRLLAEARRDRRVAPGAIAHGVLVRAQIAVQEGRYPDAVRHATEVLESCRDSGPLRGDGFCRLALHYRGVAAYWDDKYDIAVGDLERLAASPSNTDVFDAVDGQVHLALALDRRGQPGDRRRACELVGDLTDGQRSDRPEPLAVLIQRCN